MAFQRVNFCRLDKAAENFSSKSVGGTMTGERDKDQFGNANYAIGLTKVNDEGQDMVIILR